MNYTKLLPVAISIAILAMLIAYADPVKFLSLLSSSNHYFVALALALSTLNIGLRVLKWKLLLPDVKFSDVVPAQLTGITISNFTPGKLSEPVKAMLLKMKTGKPVSSLLASVVWERVFDIVIVVSLSIMGIVFFVGLSGNLLLLAYIALGVFSIGLACLLLFLSSRRFRSRVFSYMRRLPVLNKISDNFIAVFNKSEIKWHRKLASLVVTKIVWLVEGAIIYFSFAALGVQLPPFVVVAALFAIATLIGIASILPGGIGSTDIVMVIMLGLFGVEHGIAVTGVLLSRFISLWYFNVLGGLAMVYLSRHGLDYRSILK